MTLDLSSQATAPVVEKQKRRPRTKAAPVTPEKAEPPALEEPETFALDPRLLDSTTTSARRIRILNLHTDEPVVEHEGRFYLCDWTETIGTDVFIGQPEGSPAVSIDELRSKHPDIPFETAIEPSVSRPLTDQDFPAKAIITGTTTVKLVAQRANFEHAEPAVKSKGKGKAKTRAVKSSRQRSSSALEAVEMADV